MPRKLIVAIAVIALLVAACGEDEEAPATTAAPETTAAPVEEAPEEDAIEEEEPETPAGPYEAEIRPAEQPWKIGYGDGLSGIPFTDSVTDNINAIAAEMGVEIVYCDNAYDQERTVECSNLLVTQQVDGVIFANWIAGTEDLIAGIFHDAGIPCVSYDGPHPGCVAFGPDNYNAALEAGRYLAAYAQEQGWAPEDTELLLVWSADVPVHKARADGARDGVRESFAIPDENIHDIPTEGLTDTLPNVTTWATGNPDAKHVLCFGHSDQPGVDCALALEQNGFLGHAAAASLGASDEALVDLRQRSDDESVFKATISYFPERYGQYLVPAIVDLIEGKTVPERLIPSVSPVTRDNVEQLYPGGELDEEAMAAEEEYEAMIRAAEQPWKIGYGDGLSGIPFTDSVTDNINAIAAEMGVEIVYCDNAYDQERTVECSNLLVTQQVDGVIFANWIAGTEDLIAGIFHDAGIPCVSYDGPHPGCVAFGPDNYNAALEAGRYLAAYAQEQGWAPEDTELLLVWSADVPVHKARADGARDGVRESFAIPDENIHDIPTEGLTDTLPNVTTWATGNPDAKHVLCFGHSDQPGVDCALALEQNGFLGHAAAASLGASDEALVDLRQRSDDESVFKATISYFPERYGQYLVPAIVDLIEGKTVPERLIPSVSPVTRDNVFDLYPG